MDQADHSGVPDDAAIEEAPNTVPIQEKSAQPHDTQPYCAFTKRSKLFIVLTVSLAGFFSPFAINIYIPALPQIAGMLHTSEGE